MLCTALPAAGIWHNKVMLRLLLTDTACGRDLNCAAGEPAKPVWSESGTVESTVFRLVLKSRPKKNEKTNF